MTEADINTIIRKKIKNLFVSYKGFSTFALPILLMLIVGSVVTNNKPTGMQNTLVASALGSLMALGFITNVFIVLGLDYIEIRKHFSKGKQLTIATLKLVFWSMFMGIFNALFLMLFAWIFTDVSHFMAPSLFTNSVGIDWWGVTLAIFQLCILSISMSLFISSFFKSKKKYAIIGLLYFLGVGYLAGGMFGPGATYWMMFPALIMPHTYLAHFLSAALTGGHYNVAHLPTKGDILTIVEEFKKQGIKVDIDKVLNQLFIQHGSNIWDLSVFQPQKWVYKHFKIGIWNLGPFKMYNNFYQINSLNIFLPLLITLICGSTFWVRRNK